MSERFALYTRARKASIMLLHTYLGDVKTKRVHEICSSGENEIRSVDISSDGKLLYYPVYSSESDIWLLDVE